MMFEPITYDGFIIHFSLHHSSILIYNLTNRSFLLDLFHTLVRRDIYNSAHFEVQERMTEAQKCDQASRLYDCWSEILLLLLASSLKERDTTNTLLAIKDGASLAS